MKRIVVLGGGMVGRTIAADLCREYDVTVADVDTARLAELQTHYPVNLVATDLAQPGAAGRAVAGADLAINALPGYLGYAALESILAAGYNVVDISFFAEDPFSLDTLARARGLTAVVDCGVAPGLSNMVLGYHAREMAVVTFRCLVGGLPFRRTWPYQYQAPFSPIDVLEEYTRPARLVQDGQVVVRPALSDLEPVEVDPVGTLEAFNTDGLRTLLTTMQVPHMVEKTLRYPGHAELMRVLGASGFFGTDPIYVHGAAVRPIDLTAALLLPQWRLAPGEPEFTAMEIEVTGRMAGASMAYRYRLFDRTDPETGFSSMARTTGYTCTAVARLVLEGAVSEKGIVPPERVTAQEGLFPRVLAHLAARGVHLTAEAAAQ